MEILNTNINTIINLLNANMLECLILQKKHGIPTPVMIVSWFRRQNELRLRSFFLRVSQVRICRNLWLKIDSSEHSQWTYFEIFFKSKDIHRIKIFVKN
jgi:hypothetical protein